MGFEGSVPCCIFRFIVNYGSSTDNFEKIIFTVWFWKSSRKLTFLVLNFLLFALSGTLDVGITQPLYCWFVIGTKKPFLCHKCTEESRDYIIGPLEIKRSRKSWWSWWSGNSGSSGWSRWSGRSEWTGRSRESTGKIREVPHVHEKHCVNNKRSLITK